MVSREIVSADERALFRTRVVEAPETGRRARPTTLRVPLITRRPERRVPPTLERELRQLVTPTRRPRVSPPTFEGPEVRRFLGEGEPSVTIRRPTFRPRARPSPIAQTISIRAERAARRAIPLRQRVSVTVTRRAVPRRPRVVTRRAQRVGVIPGQLVGQVQRARVVSAQRQRARAIPRQDERQIGEQKPFIDDRLRDPEQITRLDLRQSLRFNGGLPPPIVPRPGPILGGGFVPGPVPPPFP